MTPEQIAASGTESGHQRALFARVNADLWQAYCQALAELHPEVDELNPAERIAAGKWDGIGRKWAAPLRWLHSIPNGGSRGDSARSKAIRGATMKAEGVKEGIPDLFLPYPRNWVGCVKYAGLYIEMKKPGGKPSKEQHEFRDYALSVGYAWHLCDTWEKAYAVLVAYLKEGV